ncbi:hypothetical protein Sru01_64140 [Sphaerisporangium rufum]|uniref:histidine kinase n=1 Tax=Sphaerisporangium rufum TaxID=1381558 RepID=A0A919V414_9ACTN|nr:HAMP domain-containing sensor histidine kinase [Sphaerisporangium rufum]GII81432.1 hypothetical protein Sru01_64140 [Sphaerisporangium rufum]
MCQPNITAERAAARQGGPAHSVGLECLFDQQRQFIADASHELFTPVAGLRAQLEEAQLHPDQTDLVSLLDDALRDVSRLQSIVTDLLLLARLRAGTQVAAEPVDLGELVQSRLCARGDRHRVQLRLDPDVWVQGQRPQLERLLDGLLDNAQRHAEHTVRLEVRRQGPAAELVVANDGEAIALADRERIFEPFTRLDTARSRDRGGTGLGLAIARDIAQAHHGTLGVEDRPVAPTAFVLRLPFSAEAAGQEPAAVLAAGR